MNENSSQRDRAYYEDRLTDLALDEVVGGKAPPKQSLDGPMLQRAQRSTTTYWRRIAAWGVALSLVCVIATLYWSASDPWSQFAWVPPPDARQTDVPVAAADLPAGKRIEPSDIIVTPMTDDEMQKRQYPLDYLMLESQQIVGRTLRQPQPGGSPFLINRFYPVGMGPNLYDRLEPGYRAVTIDVPANSNLAKSTTPGSSVDVRFFPDASMKGVPRRLYTINEGSKVLAVGEERDGRRTVTLAVTPEDAMSLRIIENGGEVSVSPANPNAPMNALMYKGKSFREALGRAKPDPNGPKPTEGISYAYKTRREIRGLLPGLGDGTGSGDHEAHVEVATPETDPIELPDTKVWRELEHRRRQFAEVELRKADEGSGAGEGGDRYSRIVENAFLEVGTNPLSTFSIDVDTASYAKVRRYLMTNRTLPPPDAVRIEELVNYFSYAYEPPSADRPFTARVEVAGCPWRKNSRLVRVALKGRVVADDARPPSNLVFLLDVSGSMDQPDKLPRVKKAMQRLVGRLGENDRVAIVVYAGASGLVLPSTTADRQAPILEALESLNPGGSTNGAAGIELAYQIAIDHFITGGTNRVLLCTDGDFNVGTTSEGELVRLVEEKAKSGVFLSVLGFGMGNHNDAMLEQISNKGNGNSFYIDSDREAEKVLIEQMGSTLVTIAKDVKIQVEFNPREVAAYRLIGYENRVMAAEDFNDDTKDAGEIGAGHTVTALYEIVPAGKPVEVPAVDPLKYQRRRGPTDAAENGELLTVKLRYKEPAGAKSTKLEFPVSDEGGSFDRASDDFQFAASVAAFGMLLRNSAYRGGATFDAVAEIAGSSKGEDPRGYRAEFVELVQRAGELAGEPVEQGAKD